jgi:hypothetical protein
MLATNACTAMTLCETCGNEIEWSTERCPYCEQLLTAPSAPRASVVGPVVITVNLEEGHPLVTEALYRMDGKLYAARKQGAKIVRLIHGWGSSGTGGAIRTAVRKKLAIDHRNNVIQRYVSGEDYLHSEVGRQMRSKFPQLKKIVRTDRPNPGITLVEL